MRTSDPPIPPTPLTSGIRPGMVVHIEFVAMDSDIVAASSYPEMVILLNVRRPWEELHVAALREMSKLVEQADQAAAAPLASVSPLPLPRLACGGS